MSVANLEQLYPVVAEAENIVGEALRWELAREIGRRLLAESGRDALPSKERPLTEVDNLNRLRLPDGGHDPVVLADVRANLVPRVVEPSMPFAVSTNYREYRNGNFWWIDQTGPQSAASGLRYHEHPSAKERVVVEIAEALEVESDLKPGRIKALVSPRMSRKDASKEVAESEHLADDDMIRIHWLDVDGAGNVRGKFMQSILVRDIPLQAWVDMLASPDNVFGKSIIVEDPESALSLMKTFCEMDVSAGSLPEGVLTILGDVVRFIADPEARAKVLESLPRYRDSQQLMRDVANDVADRWLHFETCLADSLYLGTAVPDIEKFIYDLQDQWSDGDQALFANHRFGPGFIMTRELALRLEEAKQNVLWAQAGVMVKNERIVGQMDPGVAAQIYVSVRALHEMMRAGANQSQTSEYEGRAASLSASQNVTVGGGCPGKTSGNFRKDESSTSGDPNKESSPEPESDEVCDYTHTGCYCCPYNDNGTGRSKPLEVRARRSKDGSARCLRSGCGAKLGSNGKAVSKGDIYARAQALKQKPTSTAPVEQTAEKTP